MAVINPIHIGTRAFGNLHDLVVDRLPTTGPAAKTQTHAAREFHPSSSLPAEAKLSLGINDAQILSQRRRDAHNNVSHDRANKPNHNSAKHTTSKQNHPSNCHKNNDPVATRWNHADTNTGDTTFNYTPQPGPGVPGFSHGRYCHCSACNNSRLRHSKDTKPIACPNNGRPKDAARKRDLEEKQRLKERLQRRNGDDVDDDCDDDATTLPEPVHATTREAAQLTTTNQNQEDVDFNAAHAHLRHTQQPHRQQKQPQTIAERLRGEAFKYHSIDYPYDQEALERAAKVVPDAWRFDKDGMPREELLRYMSPNHPCIRQSRSAGILPYTDGDSTYYTTRWEQIQQQQLQQRAHKERALQGHNDESGVSCSDNRDKKEDSNDDDEECIEEPRSAQRELWCWETKADAVYVPYFSVHKPKDEVKDWFEFVEENWESTF
ncbi:uncharacterized protein B0I36DRAFT_354795 [Microdochium trichocladiopsis]|uniref:Uncharacterized protein n=1 Tax=Microdochium trichocladiopsis TaxID=1682393 RepID=A0A9P9BJX4_9PEZI|nr:uncharacterized protein B0I36DRAFT_354795 [Microdochium trichocladiopsis]KAH7018525.1 hypothetical protein B0I36DRAFT_354795 [Microdochium trichocladiopsis]